MKRIIKNIYSFDTLNKKTYLCENYKNRKKANRPMLKENFFRDRMIQKQEDAEVIVEFDIAGKLFKVKINNKLCQQFNS